MASLMRITLGSYPVAAPRCGFISQPYPPKITRSTRVRSNHLDFKSGSKLRTSYFACTSRTCTE
jgi:ubiquitin-protein ligase